MHQVRRPVFGLRSFLSVLAIVALSVLSAPTSAQTYCNGGFETFTAGTQAITGGNRAAPGSGSASCPGGFGWSVTNGFNQTLGWGDSTAVITTGLSTSFGYNGSTYSLMSITAASKNGGNFLAVEDPSGTASISQTVSGLIVNQTYTVAFEQAGGIWNGGTGPSTDFWKVSFGGTTQNSPTVTAPLATGFSGWSSVQMQFVATAASMVLAFTASSNPVGQPPFALLDGISVTQQVPEPVSSALFLSGLAGLAALRRLARKRT